MPNPASNIIWINGAVLATLLEDVPNEIEFDEHGISGATLHYEVLWQYAPPLVAALKVHPDFPWLIRKSAKISREDANLARVAVTFDGIDPSTTDDDGKPEYSLEGSTSSEPIEHHWKFAQFAGKPTDPKNGATFEKIEDGSVASEANPAPSDVGYRFKDFALVEPVPDHPKTGIKSYEEKGIIYTETRTYSHSNLNTVSLNMNKLGEIDTPPSSSILPPVATGRTWLLASCSVVKIGNGMRVTRSWKLSSRNGWDPHIYSDAPITP